MRRLNFIVMVAIAAMCGAAFAADLPIPPLATPKPIPMTTPQASPSNIPVQQNQPNCSRWTDECVNCTRGASGSGPACSNIGFACQPKAIRCLSTDIPQSEPRK